MLHLLLRVDLRRLLLAFTSYSGESIEVLAVILKHVFGLEEWIQKRARVHSVHLVQEVLDVPQLIQLLLIYLLQLLLALLTWRLHRYLGF